MNAFAFLAQAASQPTANPADLPFLVRVLREGGTMLPLILGITILYFFVFRAKKKQDQQKRDLLKALTRGQKVQTIGGIIGTVVEARDEEVVLKVDETTNTKVKFTRNAIHRVIDEKSDAK